MLVDIQAKLAEGKGGGYARWAKRYNLKEMSKTLIFLQENKIGSMDEMEEQVRAATMRYHELGDSIKAAEARMAEIAVMKTHIINYAKTMSIYEAYRKARERMQELMKAQRNVEMFFADNRSEQEQQQTR